MFEIPPFKYAYAECPAATKGGAPLLSAGDYWVTGNVSSAPVVGGAYASTTNLTDGIAGDTGTGETEAAVGNGITVIKVHTSAISIATWALTVGYESTMGDNTFQYWDGSAWQNMSDTNAVSWGTHKSFLYETRVATFTGVASASIFRVYINSDSGTNQDVCSDSRVA